MKSLLASKKRVMRGGVTGKVSKLVSNLAFSALNGQNLATNKGAGVVTFTRASKDGALDFEGRVVSVSNDQPAFPSLRAVENLFIYSENASQGRTAANAGTPDFTTIQEVATSSTHTFTPTVTTEINRIYIVSFRIKALQIKRIMIRENASSGDYITFDASTGTIVSSSVAIASYKPESDGSYTIYARFPAYGIAPSFVLYLMPDNGTTFANASYLGDINRNLTLVNRQLVDITGATSLLPHEYVATTTAPITTWVDYPNPFSIASNIVIDSGVRTSSYISNGCLIEPYVTNVFSNPSSPATQSISLTTANAGKWTTTVFGSGTITITAGTGTASNLGTATSGSPRTITVTGAGTFVFTLSGGTPSCVNVENTYYGTSAIRGTAATNDRFMTRYNIPTSGVLPAGAWTLRIVFKPSVQITPNIAKYYLFGSYTDASNYLRLWYNGAILCLDKRVAGVSEFATIPFAATLGRAYEVAIIKNSDNTFQLALNGAVIPYATGPELTLNTTFTTDTDWTKGAGWTISGGKGTATAANSTAISQTTGINGRVYRTYYELIRTAGTFAAIAGNLGTDRTSSGNYTEDILCNADGTSFGVFANAASCTGTVDNASFKELYNGTTSAAITLASTFDVGGDGTGNVQAVGYLGQITSYSVSVPQTQPYVTITVEGDSISEKDVGLGRTNWPYQMTSSTIFPRGSFINFAAGGNTVANMVTQINTHGRLGALPTPATTSTRRYYFIMAGINDISAGTAATTIYNNLKTIWAAAKADGYTVITFTVLPSLGLSAPKQTELTALNVAILSDPALYGGNIRADLLLPDPNNVTYYLDGTHPTPAGSLIISNAVAPVLDALYLAGV